MLSQIQTGPIMTAFLVLFVLGCSDGAEQTSRILKANAGPDIRVTSGDTIVLDVGDSSYGTSISYSWDVLSGPTDPLLFNGSLRTRHEVLTAPIVNVETVWVVELTVH